MLANQRVKFEELKLLSTNESKVLSTLLERLAAAKDDQEEIDKVLRYLTTYPLKLVYALSENSELLNKLCNENAMLTKSWCILLQRLNYPAQTITSIDSKTVITPFATLKGAYLMSEIQKNPDLNQPNTFAMLGKACELGLYHALIMRLNFYADKLKQQKGKLDPETTDLYIQFILKDAEKLSQCYWSPGCLNAALTLFDIINYTFSDERYRPIIERFFMPSRINKFSWLTQYDDRNCPFPVRLLEAAIEMLYLTSMLADFSESKLLIDQITSNQGLLATLGSNMTTPDDVQRLIISKLDSLSVPLTESFCRASFQHALSTVNKHYPDYQPSYSPASINHTGKL